MDFPVLQDSKSIMTYDKYTVCISTLAAICMVVHWSNLPVSADKPIGMTNVSILSLFTCIKDSRPCAHRVARLYTQRGTYIAMYSNHSSYTDAIYQFAETTYTVSENVSSIPLLVKLAASSGTLLDDIVLFISTVGGSATGLLNTNYVRFSSEYF